MYATATDVSDGTEDVKLDFEGMKAGSNAKLLTLSSSNIVINEDSNDVDFRVESNGNANMLFVDGGNDKVGIGNSAPTETLEVTGDVVFNSSAGNKGLAIKPTSAGSTTILLNTFADNSSCRNWAIRNRYNAHGMLEFMRGTTNTDAPLLVHYQKHLVHLKLTILYHLKKKLITLFILL